MPKRLNSNLLQIVIGFISLVAIFVGGFIFQANLNPKPAQVLGESVEVRAVVLPNPNANLNAGGTTIYYSNLPVVTLGDITIDGKMTNFPITCSFYFQNLSGQAVTVVTIAKDINACTFDFNATLEQQNAVITQGNLEDILSQIGPAQVQITASLAGKSITTNSIPLEIKLESGEFGPNLNTQNLNLGLSPIDGATFLENDLFLAFLLGLIGFVGLFLVLLGYFKIPKYRDFIGDFSLESTPSAITVGGSIQFVSRLVDLDGQAMSNIECILTVTTPAGNITNLHLITNQGGMCGVYISSNGLLNNLLALEQENLSPAQLLNGDFTNFNSTLGSGTAYLKAKNNSQQFRSEQLVWSVGAKN